MILLPAPARRRLGKIGAFAGWFAVYVAVGGLLGFVLARHYGPFCLFCDAFHPKPNCMPELELFGAIESRCPVPFVNWFWFLLLGVPRIFLIAAGLGGVAATDAFSPHPDPSDAFLLVLGGAVMTISAGFAWLAFLHWRRRAPRAVIAVAITIALDIVLYGKLILSPA